MAIYKTDIFAHKVLQSIDLFRIAFFYHKPLIPKGHMDYIQFLPRQMFMDTFTRVGEEFRIYFRMLFGGGEAHLELLDPDNVLESGIEIVAKPPGKKLQSISLLSGG